NGEHNELRQPARAVGDPGEPRRTQARAVSGRSEAGDDCAVPTKPAGGWTGAVVREGERLRHARARQPVRDDRTGCNSARLRKRRTTARARCGAELSERAAMAGPTGRDVRAAALVPTAAEG